MASNESTDTLLDLLYGELEEEEAVSARASLAEDPEAMAELASYEELLGRVREAMPTSAEPSAGVRASILEAARQASAEQTAQTARAMRYPPPQEPSLWNRINLSAVAQIAAVAGVLIVGTFLFSSYQASNEVTERFSVASSAAPTTEQALARGGGEAAEVAAAAEEAPEADGALAMADVAGEPEDQELEAVAAEPEGNATAGDDDPLAGQQLAQLDEAQRPTKDADKLDDLLAGSAAPREAAPARRSRRSVSAKKKAEVGPVDDLFGGDVPGPEKDAAEGYAAGGGDAAGGPSAAAVASSYGRSDYEGAIENADALLARKGGVSATERARALEYKAMALEKLGRFRQADEVYTRLQQNHPRYRNEAVARRRSTLRDQIAAQAAREARAEERAAEEAKPAAKPAAAKKARRKAAEPVDNEPAAEQEAEKEYLFDDAPRAE